MVKFQLLFLSLVTVSLAAYTTKSKKGKCPFNAGEVGICSDCSSDYDCPGSKKCCSSSIGPCATYCVVPVLGIVGSIGSTSRRISSIDSIRAPGLDTIDVVSSRRVIKTGGGGKDLLHAGTGGIDGFIGGDDLIIGGSRRVIGGSGRAGSIGATSLGHISGGTGCHYECDTDKQCATGYICVHTKCGSTCKIEIHAGSGRLVGGHVGISDKAILRTVGRVIGDGIVDAVDAVTGRSGSGLIRGVDIIPGGSIRTSGIIGGSSAVIGGGCKIQCDTHKECGTNRYCVTVGCSKVCRSGRVLKNDYKS